MKAFTEKHEAQAYARYMNLAFWLQRSSELYGIVELFTLFCVVPFDDAIEAGIEFETI